MDQRYGLVIRFNDKVLVVSVLDNGPVNCSDAYKGLLIRDFLVKEAPSSGRRSNKTCKA